MSYKTPETINFLLEMMTGAKLTGVNNTPENREHGNLTQLKIHIFDFFIFHG